MDAANATDQQSSVMRLGSLATSSILVQKGLEPIYQMVCRDRNRIALQSDLLSAWVMGIRKVLAITGDLIKQMKPMCQDVYIMAIGWGKRVPQIIQAAGL